MSSFRPFDRMRERLTVARGESDTAYFFALLYWGEMLAKTITATMVAAIRDDPDRHRYRLLHQLVRADGVGEWANVLDEALVGPASQHLLASARDEQQELTQRLGDGAWQAEAVAALQACITALDPAVEKLPTKVDLRRWFHLFALFRNRTRGHGAVLSEPCSTCLPLLERSLELVANNTKIAKREWAYLRQNLSGKYRVVALTSTAPSFEPLKSNVAAKHIEGVYIHLGEPVRVELMYSGVDATDFLYPNGAFNGKTFEALSYISGTTERVEAAPYLTPSGSLPASETEGLGLLDVQGDTFANLPPMPQGYVQRSQLQESILSLLLDDHHSIVTLSGRGGIGKTWLALAVLHDVCSAGRYAAILWLSARDIDLLPSGPKVVRPTVLSIPDIARSVVRLLGAADGTKPEAILSEHLGKSPLGPLLFVLDNFETVSQPAEVYAWLDHYVRPPNKVLITTRTRDFRGDYPVDIGGMTEEESNLLISEVAGRLGVLPLLTDGYRQDLYREAEGHPYVTRVLLGEVAKAGHPVNVERLMASRDEILDALFERTYAALSPSAKRVFLTLCAWRAALPQLGIEAVLLRPSNERMDIQAAVDELERMSLIESSVSPEDNAVFLMVPLAASLFGKRKLATSSMRSAVEADVELLMALGAGRITDVRHGAEPRIRRLFAFAATRITEGSGNIAEFQPMLEYVARQYPPAWLLLASLWEELGDIAAAKEALRRYIERSGGHGKTAEAWVRLIGLCEASEDWLGLAHALVETAELSGADYRIVRRAAARLNELLQRWGRQSIDAEEKRVIVRRLVAVMERRIEEADATDLSRIAWLHLHLRDEQRARQMILKGLVLEPDNYHLQRLAERLGASPILN
jgi:hypothetical protein